MGSTCNDRSSMKAVFLLLKISAIPEIAISQVINPSESLFQINLIYKFYCTFFDRETGNMLCRAIG